ncbi:MAG: hypothetical protein ABS79_01255, partial [Planctomycetes bacterium SCN 63-9]
MRRGRALDIAIVGMACRFPGADDLVEFWANILASRDCISDVPADRWPLESFYDPDSTSNDRVACRRGGYLKSPIGFDAAANGIMPLAIDGGEPEQFLVLEAARNALADASINIDEWDRRRVEVVIGRGNYFNRGNLTRLQHGRIVAQTVGLLAALHPEWTHEDLELIRKDLKSSLPPFEAATIPGQLTNATAGRIADRLDLSGANFVVDAASASSLVALDLGSRALRDGRADLAIVGGVYLEADVDFPLVFRQLNALSRSGSSRPFAQDADGMIPGEGVGVVVLKRLREAERAGDRIYSVLKGVGIASDGKGRGLAAPSARGHARAVRRAYRAAKIDPSTIKLIEGHGLGLPAADRAEVRALHAVFGGSEQYVGTGSRHSLKNGSTHNFFEKMPDSRTFSVERKRRILGAVSSQIGHAMPAAGMAGLIKTALSLHHRILPPTRHSEKPLPLLNDAGFELLSAPRPWIHADETPRRAGVNAFGFAGINAHAILEEHAVSADGSNSGVMLDWDTEAILLSAENRENLADRVLELLNHLEHNPEYSLKDLAYTLNTAPETHKSTTRIGFVVASIEGLKKHLKAVEAPLRDPNCRQIKDSRGIYFWHDPVGRDGRLAFLFPGEGSQYPGMLADLCPHFPELRAVFDNADKIARESGEPHAPSEHLFAASNEDVSALWMTDTAVTTVLTAQWALYQILTRLGLKPSAVAGHSSGELLALTAAGAIRMERSLEQQFSRLSSIFRELEESGAIPEARLVAFGTDRQKVEAACQSVDGSVVVAIDNCPHQVVVAGSHDDVERVVEVLQRQGVLCEDLPFARAYHTSAFASVVEPLSDFYERLEFHKPTVPIYSCASARLMPERLADIRGLAVAQWTLPVAFRETIEEMHRDGLRVFVDVGARGNLCGYVEDTLRGSPFFAVAANLPRRSGTAQLNHLVASLFAQGVSLAPGYLYARRRPLRIDFEAATIAPAPTVPLQIGFPEMRLSEAVIAKFRRIETKHQIAPTEKEGSRNGIHAEAAPKDSSPLPLHRFPHLNPQHENGTSSGNGETGFGNRFSHMGNGHHAYSNGNGFHGPSEHNGHDQPPSEHEEVGAIDPQDEIAPSDAAMLSYLGSMNDFLNLQREVLGTFLNGPEHADATTTLPASWPTEKDVQRTSSDPGPWIGEILEWIPGESIVTRRPLDPVADPVAEHHTIGGRRVSELDPDRRGLPVVPFSVMAEMVAQVGALVVEPGLVLEAIESVHAHKWVQYSESHVLELRGTRSEEEPRKIHVALYHRPIDGSDEGRLVYEGIACFAEERPEPIEAEPFQLAEPEECVFTAERLYDEQWLFHGPAMQALTEIGPLSLEGATGTIEVLPLAELVEPGKPVVFYTDPIVVDTFTHLLGCWGLDRFEEGDVIFPLGMGRLSLFGDDPPTGTPITCRIRVREIERYRILVDVELVRPDGRLWMTIEEWSDWRFYWPGRYRDVFRAPDLVLIGEEMPLPETMEGNTCAVWLAPPVDMGRPVWREVLEQTQLAPPERSGEIVADETDLQRSHRIWGRVAAKEAVRRLWLSDGAPPRYPADLCIETGRNGRLRLIDLAEPDRTGIPSIAIAHDGGAVMAIASREPSAQLGLGLAPIDGSPVVSDDSMLTERETS